MGRKKYNYDGNWYINYPKSQPIQVNEDEGIRLKSKRGDIVRYWWSKRWIATLESFRIGARLERGKSYARKGQVLSIIIEQGLVNASVQGSKIKPYKVNIKIKTLTNQEWDHVAEVLASKAIFATKLLSGEMPQNVEDAFIEAKVSLFPQKIDDLKTNCSCPDYSNPCKHIAAVYYILAERFDEDPFLIFELRGKSKNHLMQLLQEKRSIQISENCISDQKKLNSQGISQDEHDILIKNINNFWDTPEFTLPLNIHHPAIENALLKRLGPFQYQSKKYNLIENLSKAYIKIRKSTLKKVLNDENP